MMKYLSFFSFGSSNVLFNPFTSNFCFYLSFGYTTDDIFRVKMEIKFDLDTTAQLEGVKGFKRE